MRCGAPTLAGQLLALQLAIIVVVLVAVAAVSLAQSEATFNRVEGRRVSALAEQLAANPLVRGSLSVPEERTGPGHPCPAGWSSSPGSRRSPSPTPTETSASPPTPRWTAGGCPVGSTGVGEGASWSGTLELEGDRQLVAQVPVLGVEEEHVGSHLGTVMVAERLPLVWERLRGASSYLLTYLGIALVLGLVGSWLLARRIKRQTLRPGAARDRRPRRAPRGDAATASPRASSRSTRSTGSPWSTRSPGACSTCPSTRSGSAWPTCASRAGCATSWSARAPSGTSPARRRAAAPTTCPGTRSSSAAAGCS